MQLRATSWHGSEQGIDIQFFYYHNTSEQIDFLDILPNIPNQVQTNRNRKAFRRTHRRGYITMLGERMALRPINQTSFMFQVCMIKVTVFQGHG